MNAWLSAATALLIALIPCSVVCVRGRTMEQLIALELASLLTALIIVLLAEGLDRPSLYDLALGLTLLSFPATLVYAHFLERWL